MNSILRRAIEAKYTLIALTAIMLLAFGLRVWGIDNGLPYGQVTDETPDISTSLNIAAGETPSYPFHRVAWSMTQLPIHALHFACLRLTQGSFGVSDFEARYYTHRGDFILVTRLYLALIAALTLIPVYFLGKAVTDSPIGGLLVALLAAVQPLYVYLSHLALPDSYALLWITLTLLGSVQIYKTGSRYAVMMVGAGVALVMLTRLQAASVAIAPALAVFLRWDEQRRNKSVMILIVWALLGFVVAGVIFNPFLILNPRAAYDDFKFIINERFSGEIDNRQLFDETPTRTENIRDNIDLPLILMRPALAALALLGTLLALYRRDRVALIVACFWLVFTLSLLPSVRPRLTYWLPAAIPAVVLGAYAVAVMARQPQKWLRWGAALVFTTLFALALRESLQIDHALAQTHTLLLARDYVEETIPAESKILIGENFVYSVPLNRTAASIQRMATLTELPPSYTFFLDNPEQAPQPQYDLFGNEYRDELDTLDDWTPFLETHQIAYVIEADYCDERAPLETQIPDITRQHLELIYTISPFKTDSCEMRIENRTHMEYMKLNHWMRVGPIVRIYRVEPD